MASRKFRVLVMVVFNYEPLDYMLQTGLPELSLECWEQMDDGFYNEIFSPDWKMYKEQEDRKNLGFVSMRNKGKLVGYGVIKTVRDIHQKDMRIAVLHDIYITAEFRGHAVAFFHYIEQFVKKMDCYRLDVAERLSFDEKRGGIGKFYSLLGFRPMEVIWAKVLGQEGTA